MSSFPLLSGYLCDLFEDIRKQAASLSVQQDAAIKEAQEVILGKLK